MDKKYQVKYIYPAIPNQHCENCGKAISFAAKLVGSDGSILRVGLDCAATLADRYISNKGFKVSRAVKALKKHLAKEVV